MLNGPQSFNGIMLPELKLAMICRQVYSLDQYLGERTVGSSSHIIISSN
jgi:hypothetical protein